MQIRRSFELSFRRRSYVKWTLAVVAAGTLLGVLALPNASAQAAAGLPALNATLTQLNATVNQLVATVNQLVTSVNQTAAGLSSLDSYVRGSAGAQLLATAPLHNGGGVVPYCTVTNIGSTTATVTISAKRTFGVTIQSAQQVIPAGQSSVVVGSGGWTETWCLFQSDVPASQLRAAMELVNSSGQFLGVTEAR